MAFDVKEKIGVFTTFLTIAFSATLTATSPDPRAFNSPFKEIQLSLLLPFGSRSSREDDAESRSRNGVEDMFSLRFDELRFIETPMTTHQ
ncbi:hypothetical protein C4D60_Mb08t32310 [Musa balbisiana]|uniref:Uncharacterized protein n=1 Tax=Musa balbisiana TaxID=52838 RepID=A0A4S8K827_MUSBA|nr:hypothetical protein C4D60_Mb08t32310 [Musa balbisiana]